MPVFLLDDLLEYQRIPCKLKFDLVSSLLSFIQDRRIKNRANNRNICICKLGPIHSTKSLTASKELKIVNCILEINQSSQNNWKHLIQAKIIYLIDCSVSSFKANVSTDYLVLRCSSIMTKCEDGIQFDFPLDFPSIFEDQFDLLVQAKGDVIQYEGFVTKILSRELGIYVLDDTILFLSFGLNEFKHLSKGESISIHFVHPFKLNSGCYKFAFVACCCTSLLSTSLPSDGGCLREAERLNDGNNSLGTQIFRQSLTALCNPIKIFDELKVWNKLQMLRTHLSSNRERADRIVQRAFLKYLFRGREIQIKNEFSPIIDHYNQCYLNNFQKILSTDNRSSQSDLHNISNSQLFLSPTCLFGFLEVDSEGQIRILDSQKSISVRAYCADVDILDFVGNLCLIFEFKFERNSFLGEQILIINDLPCIAAAGERKSPLLKNSFLCTNIYPMMKDGKKGSSHFFIELTDLHSKETCLCQVHNEACCNFPYLQCGQSITLFDFEVVDKIIHVFQAHSIRIEGQSHSNVDSSWTLIEEVKSTFIERKGSRLVAELVAVVLDFYQPNPDISEILFILKQSESDTTISLIVDIEKFVFPSCIMNGKVLYFRKLLLFAENGVFQLKYVQFSTVKYLADCNDPIQPKFMFVNNFVKQHPIFPIIFNSFFTVIKIISMKWARKKIPKECGGCRKRGCNGCYDFGNFFFELVLAAHDYTSEFNVVISDYNKLFELFNDLDHFVEDSSESINKLSKLFKKELYFKCALHFVNFNKNENQSLFLSQNVTYHTKSPVCSTFVALDMQRITNSSIDAYSC